MSFIKNLSNRKNVMNIIGDKCGYIDVDNEFKKMIQSNLLEMLLDIDKVCTENGIEYFLNGGSCLGAIRHKGFIPWDDDVDLFMTRREYNRFKEIFDASMGDKYILNAPNYSKESITRFPKVLKKDSLYVTSDTLNLDLCKLYIDIFILDNVPDNKLVRYIKGIICNLLEFISGQVLFIKNSSCEERKIYKEYDAFSYYICFLIGKTFSFISVSTYNNLIDKVIQYKNSDTKCYGAPTDCKHYFGEIYPRDFFATSVRVLFEENMLPVPIDYEGYLKQTYGDYMKIPDETDREHHYVKKIKL